MSIPLKVFFVICSTIVLMSSSACKKEGPAERAGRNIDDAAGKAAEKIDDVGKSIKDATK